MVTSVLLHALASQHGINGSQNIRVPYQKGQVTPLKIYLEKSQGRLIQANDLAGRIQQDHRVRYTVQNIQFGCFSSGRFRHIHLQGCRGRSMGGPGRTRTYDPTVMSGLFLTN